MVDMLCVCGVEVDRVSRNAGGSDIEGSRRRGGRNGNVGREGREKGKGVTALHIASYYDSLAAAKVLIDHGAAVELHTSSGELALAEAIANSSIGMVDLLLSEGISIHAAVDASGGTPLMAACFLGDLALVRCLMRHGAGRTVLCRDREGETAISVAAACAGRRVLEVLVEAGADVNCRNEKGETPLEIAIRKGKPAKVLEVVDVLLRAGARRNGGVERALDEAVRDGGGSFDFEVVDLLNRYGGPPGGGCGRKSDGSFDEMSQRSDETLRIGGYDEYDGRVTRYMRKPNPDFVRSSRMGRAPSPSIYSEDGMSTELDSSVFSESASSRLNRDRRIMKWSAEQDESPVVRRKTGSLFGETWDDGFDSGFDGAFGSERSEYNFGSGRGRGRRRGRVTNIVSFTVYS